MRVTKHIEFETAHLLPGYDGGCGNLHGHSYKLEVTVQGPQNDGWGMVIDFKKLKKCMEEIVPDHRYIYNAKESSEIEKDLVEVLKKHDIKFQGMPFDTTAENMVKYFAEMIEQSLQNNYGYPGVKVVEAKLWETSNSYATYIAPEQLSLFEEEK